MVSFVSVFSRDFGLPILEGLREKISNVKLQTNYSSFQNAIHEAFGPLSHSGIRGVIQLSDLMKIGTEEGSSEVEIDAGIRRIKSDYKLQDQLLRPMFSKKYS